jgi:hypothetical protein
MKPNLPPSVSSRQDLKAVVMELQGYLHWLSQNQIKQEVTQQAFGDRPDLSGPAQEILNQEQAGQEITKESLTKLIESLEAFAAKAPYVSVTLAAPAPRPLREEVVSWFRKNVNHNMLVDFSFNATMLGGMVIRYGSHVFDWSFKRQIMAGRAKFPEVLRNV